ncbi:hydroxymethylpyrimidine permease [Loigolactobacillus backii]|uniref:putative hydroxymethylpyrimidine transporter CytX n=1 Tax=Loigolactobacillus TaxID=2767889 RepID=UPI000C1C9357|nr:MULTISPECIES: putative hydroxymethylpyrimidine transporter CytX [Loigolactobacillus]PIO82360.1 hydroxymethylpyrimidine permease [Loigolactobacillus backii]
MKENSRISGQFLLWLGAAISIAEIITGTLIAPLGLAKGFLAILVGHILGCFVFLLPAAIMGGRQRRTAIASTHFAFGHLGVQLFSLLNALQLIGWTAVMIANAISALNGVSGRLFNFKSALFMGLIMAALLIFWLLINNDWLFRINNLVVALLFIGSLIMLWLVLRIPQHASVLTGNSITFGAAVELGVTMALSWLPLIADYTSQTEEPIKVSWASTAGYFIGSLFMFSIGLLSAVRTGKTDITTILVSSGLGILALFIIIFSTVTTTFLDAHSAAVNVHNIWKKLNLKWLASGVVLIGLIIALVVPLSLYQQFLYLIGSIFAPLYTIVFVNYFLLKRPLKIKLNFIFWLVGVVGYYWLQQFNFILGTTTSELLLLGSIVWLTGYFINRSK